VGNFRFDRMNAFTAAPVPTLEDVLIMMRARPIRA
jgi:hypothetical protein